MKTTKKKDNGQADLICLLHRNRSTSSSTRTSMEPTRKILRREAKKIFFLDVRQ